jgi:hypothetical protein
VECLEWWDVTGHGSWEHWASRGCDLSHLVTREDGSLPWDSCKGRRRERLTRSQGPEAGLWEVEDTAWVFLGDLRSEAGDLAVEVAGQGGAGLKSLLSLIGQGISSLGMEDLGPAWPSHQAPWLWAFCSPLSLVTGWSGHE